MTRTLVAPRPRTREPSDGGGRPGTAPHDRAPTPGVPLYLRDDVDLADTRDAPTAALDRVAPVPIPAALAGAAETSEESADATSSSTAEEETAAEGETEDGSAESPDEEGEGEEESAASEAGEGPEGAEREEAAGDAGSGGARGGGGASSAAEFDEAAEATEEAPLPAALASSDEEVLTAPSLQWTAVSASWPLASDLPPDALPKPPGPSPTRSPAQGQENGAQQKQDSQADPEALRRVSEASALAQRAYQDLSRAARTEQQGFVSRANSIAQGMSRTYESSALDVMQRLTSDRSAVDGAAQRATNDIERVGTQAAFQLESSQFETATAIEGAGRLAYAMIAAGMASSGRQIERVVSGLITNFNGQCNTEINKATDKATEARTQMNAWRDARETNHPTSGDALPAAKNESILARIPTWVTRETDAIAAHLDPSVEAWNTSRDTTVCGIGCRFKASLEGENRRMAATGRSAVASSLKNARRTLESQARDGKRALRQMVRSALDQIRVQQRSARSNLTSIARMAIGTLRSEAQNGVGGVQAAARGALSSFWRGVQGFEQSVRQSAPKGAAGVERLGRTAAPGILEGLNRTTAGLHERLNGNRDRLEVSIGNQLRSHRDRSSGLVTQNETTMLEQRAESEARCAESVGGFITAFGELAGTVRQAAASWAEPLASRMSSFIRSSRGNAQGELDGFLNGGAGGGAESTGDGEAATDAAEGDEEGGEAACGECETESEGESTNEAGADAGGGEGESEGPSGLKAQVQEVVTFITPRVTPVTFFAPQVTETGNTVRQNLDDKATSVSTAFEGGFAGTVDEEGAVAALRGLTALKGHALDTVSYPAKYAGNYLSDHLWTYLNDDPNDYAAAMAYLRGDAVEGARIELEESRGFFNDQEDRIEQTMAALSPSQLAELGELHPGVMADTRAALGGTDRDVFDALAAGEHARAAAYRLRDSADTARHEEDADATHTAIETHTRAGDEDWRYTEDREDLLPENHRAAVIRELGTIVSDTISDEDVARATREAEAIRAPGSPEREVTAEEAAALAYLTRDVMVYRHGGGPHGEGGSFETSSITGANRDLTYALALHGPGSVEARSARLGVELQRGGRPDPAKLDAATFDDNFLTERDLANATPEQRAAHQRAAEMRARVMMLASERYTADESAPEPSGEGEAPRPFRPAVDPNNPEAAMDDERVMTARDRLIARLRERYGSDTLGANLAAGLLTDARPSPATVARAMRYGMQGCGTNEELLFRFTERMNRDEIAEMRLEFTHQTGGLSLDAEMGTYGEGGFFTELSGDDRLRMERALRGVARNDRERLENAAFAIAQQRREAGPLGAYLAEGSLAELGMIEAERRLEMLAGGPIALDRRGDLLLSLPNFRGDDYVGAEDRDSFLSTTYSAAAIAQNYANRIDRGADLFTTAIAIVGAIAAAVIGVVTGGAAVPLMLAALGAGLASMAANYAIKGGRYGWEQGALDLGMTLVQVVTAGVGAQLGAASRLASGATQVGTKVTSTLTALSKIFTGNPVVDQIIIGAITGSISGLGSAALNERTWEGKDPVGALFDGLIRGALSGAATAAVTNSIEALGRNAQAIRERAQALAAQGGLGSRAGALALGGVARVARGINTALGGAAEGKAGDSMFRAALRSAGRIGARSVTRSAIQGLGGMAGRGTEILYDASRGKYRGDAGSALLEMGQAGLHAALQGLGEGAAEAVGQRFYNQRVAAASESINRVREELGLRPLEGDDLHTAAEDLLFLKQHGRLRGAVGDMVNTDFVAETAIVTTRATVDPHPRAVAVMREELVRHIPPERRADFADVPIRVMSEADYRAFARSDAGPVVTIIENGRPVIVVREGTPTSRLADEGPHLMQARDQATREAVARLDEATLRRWDSLDVDTQMDLYRTKIGLEIDAHEQIARSLERRLARGDGDPESLRAEIERNEGTLRNLRNRRDEVAAIGPEQLAAMAARPDLRPDYLEQPARLFSKDDTVSGRRGTADEDEPFTPATEPPGGHPEGDRRRGRIFGTDELLRGGRGGRFRDRVTAEEVTQHDLRLERGRGFNTEMEGQFRFNEVAVVKPDGGRGNLFVDSYVPGREIVERFHSQLEQAELSANGVDTVIAKMNKVADLYDGARIADTDRNAELLRINREIGAGDRMRGRLVLQIEEQRGPIPREILEQAERLGMIIRDRTGREYSTAYPSGDDRAPRASAPDQERQAAAMREALLRRVPPDQRDELADVQIYVLDAALHRFRDPVVTMMENGRRIVYVRDGTPIPRLTSEGLRLTRPDDGVPRASARDPLVLRDTRGRPVEDAMREQLLRHVPPDQREALGNVPIRVLSEREYQRLTRSESGPVVTIIENGRPVIVVREGTPITRLSDEGPHLVQARAERTRGQVARLDEETMRRWDSLDLDEQLSLYRTKIALEIDAHTRIQRSLRRELADGVGDPARIRAEIERNEGTLNNLRARRDEVDSIGARRRSAIEDAREARPQWLDQPPRLFSKDSPAGPGYRDQPDLRAPRVAAEPGSELALRQRHEDWVQEMRQRFLTPGTRPPMVEGEPPRPARYPWHADIESAYAAYDALVRQYNGQREVGIYRNADTGEYMVALGSAVNVGAPREALRQETVLHYHPDYGPSLYRGPSGTDLTSTAALAREIGRPVTEFIEYSVPGGGRGRTAFTLTPVQDDTVPGRIRMQIDLEFINPATGEYEHQRYALRRDWRDYYGGRTTALDPDQAVYWHLMRSLGLSDEQIRMLAAGHRDPAAPPPPTPEFLPPRGSRGNNIVGDDDIPGVPRNLSDPTAEMATLYETARRLRELQREPRRLAEQLAQNEVTRGRLEAELLALRSDPTRMPSDREAQIARRLAALERAATEMRNRRDILAAEVASELRRVLRRISAEINADFPLLIRLLRQFGGGRLPSGRELVYSLRDMIDPHTKREPPADLLGLISQSELELNIIAVQYIREDMLAIRPDAILAVERGGAFLAEVLGDGMVDFPPTVTVAKHVEQRSGEQDVVRRIPHLEAEIRRRIARGERTFAVVDFYMGGVFAKELQNMFVRLHTDFPEAGLMFHVRWIRETHRFERLMPPRAAEDMTPDERRARLTERAMRGDAMLVVFTDPLSGETRKYLRLRRRSDVVTLPAVKGNVDNLPYIQIVDYPVGIVLGDDMRTVFDPASDHPIRIFDQDGEIVQEIPVGIPDPLSGERIRNTREIIRRLMQGVRFPGATKPVTVP